MPMVILKDGQLADYKHFNSALAISSFLSQGSGLLQKLVGVHPC
jgi:hypothetical protein